MSDILTVTGFLFDLNKAIWSGYEKAKNRLKAHDAALREEIDRLKMNNFLHRSDINTYNKCLRAIATMVGENDEDIILLEMVIREHPDRNEYYETIKGGIAELKHEIAVRDKAIEIMINDMNNSYSFWEDVIADARKEMEKP